MMDGYEKCGIYRDGRVRVGIVNLIEFCERDNVGYEDEDALCCVMGEVVGTVE